MAATFTKIICKFVIQILMSMIVFEEAYRLTVDAARPMGTEQISMNDAVGRVLAKSIVSDINMPPFDKTAVDGYACKRANLNNTLEVIEIIPAGFAPKHVVGVNQCAKIMTGAKMPEGADCVIMVEDTEDVDEKHIRFAKEKTANNICLLAEDVKEGTTILEAGNKIRPQDIAMMASVGHTTPTVFKKPRVAIISTGNELVEPDVKPGDSKIRNSNAYQLLAQTRRAGAQEEYLGIALDDKESLKSYIDKGINNYDVTILTGGVSMGDFDFVPIILKEAGIELLFKSIAVQPGKPTVFGKSSDGKYVFGLPGNPVSSFVQFELIVKPFLHHLMGNEYKPLQFNLPLAKDYSRKKFSRDKWEPANITADGKIELSSYHGSAHIHALSHSDVLIKIPRGVEKLKAGALVHVRQI